MRVLLLPVVALVLAGCTAKEQIPLEAPIVVQPIEQKVPNVPEVAAPPKAAIPRFSFQSPHEPTTIVGLDADNYAAFRSALLVANQRELQWQNKLSQANRSIRLLKGTTAPMSILPPATKPISVPIPTPKPS